MYIYIITYLIIQILGYGLSIDALKIVVITEDSTKSTFPGVPLLLSLMLGSIVYYNTVRQNNFN
ncbi:hypothetical protein RBH29_16360 [Herbivorax sp. ANBcel31]|uniref:hypothetical protein n=1 Tax=Herbivorax sp. ANBcel31 TaxID=3069754 RepID=UPI0027AF05E1|nr:hypothetical protein [Herbivorax sp. ANBcel31]MDQ2088003.1 hypothetical protein [Herbivorax sp. ANBcel31]